MKKAYILKRNGEGSPWIESNKAYRLSVAYRKKNKQEEIFPDCEFKLRLVTDAQIQAEKDAEDPNWEPE